MKEKHPELVPAPHGGRGGITPADIEWCMTASSNNIQDGQPLGDVGDDHYDYSDGDDADINVHNESDSFEDFEEEVPNEPKNVTDNVHDNGSYLHSETWEHVYKRNEGVHAFPFPNKVSYRFHLWRCLRGHMISDDSLDALLSIFCEEIPGFKEYKDKMLFKCKTVKSFLNKMDKRLPKLPTYPVSVTQDKTAYDAASSKRKIKVSTTVSCFKVGSILEYVFSTRHLRKHLQFGYDDVGTDRVYEFNQTPFVREAYKYQQLISFTTDTEEVMVGDFVRLEGSSHPVQVESLFYQQRVMSEEGCGARAKEGECMPPLCLRAVVCDIISRRGSPLRLALRRDRNLVVIPATRVLRKLSLDAPNVDLSAWEVRNRDGTSTQFRSQRNALTPQAVLRRDPYVWLNFYIDKFDSAGKNAKSTEAVYMEIANVDSRFSGGQEFVFTITLLPAGCALAEAWEPVRVELARLVKHGVSLYDCFHNVNRAVGVGVAGLIGDHMQQVVSTRTFGPVGTLNSRACVGRKDENHLTITGSKECCAHFSTARRQAQTDVVVLQIEAALSARAQARANKQRTQVCPFLKCCTYTSILINSPIRQFTECIRNRETPLRRKPASMSLARMRRGSPLSDMVGCRSPSLSWAHQVNYHHPRQHPLCSAPALLPGACAAVPVAEGQ